METSWFYAQDGDRKGPVSRDELQLAVTRGEVDRKTLVWTNGMAQWQPLESVEELEPLLQHIPPPLPPPLPPPVPPQPTQARFQHPATPPAPRGTPGGPGSHLDDPRDHGRVDARSPRDRRRRRPRGRGLSAGWVGTLVDWLLTVLLGWKGIMIVFVPVIVVVLYLILPDKVVPPKPKAMGQIRIDANPWGQVEWIRGPGGRNVDLSAGRTTPLLMSLPIGNYQAQVSFPHAQASQRCELRVQPGQLATCWLELAPVDAKSYFEKIGW